MRHLIKAASAGDADAQCNLGILYDSRLDDNGHSITGNRAQAIKWLLEAAQQGLPRAQMRLAELYVDGPGRSGSHAKACFWFLLASMSLVGAHRERAQLGYHRAAAELTPQEIEVATRRSQLWQPTKRATVAPGRTAIGQRSEARQ